MSKKRVQMTQTSSRDLSQKRATNILLILFLAIFVYSVFQYDKFGGSGEAVRAPIQRQPSYFAGATQPGGSIGSSTINHTACFNNQCIVVQGPGVNQCSSNADCASNISSRRVTRVFVTSNFTTGVIGGYQGGVNFCMTAAQRARLPGQWTPWLSVKGNATMSDIDAQIRIPPGPYALLNGRFVAVNKQDLLDGTLQRPININEFGNVVTDFGGVWTGTNSIGRNTGLDCKGWTTNNGFITGTTGYTRNWLNQSWTDGSENPCVWSQHLYCFEK